MIETVLFFFVILSVLVLVHEGGHFFAAKFSGIRVEEFGIGFPPKVFSRRFGETLYSFNLLPLGGFVRIAGENAEEVQEPSRSFAGKPFWIKWRVLLSGVVINWIFAAMLFGVLQILGAPTAVSDEDVFPSAAVTIASVMKSSPAQEAGFLVGDKILEMQSGSEAFRPKKIGDTQSFLRSHAGEGITFLLERHGASRTLAATPRLHPPEGEGALGIVLTRVAIVSYPWYEAFSRGFFIASSLTISLIAGVAEIFRGFFSGHVAEGLAGPVGIAALVGEVRMLGVIFLLNFTALLSLNLAILNALPFPPLDGGRALLVLLERLARRTVPSRALALLNSFGFAVLILAILAITVRDVKHLL